MLKKYLFTFILIFSFFFIFSNKSFAIWNKNFGTAGCSATFVVLQVCEGYVVSANDFADSFEVQGNDNPGKKLSFWGDYQDGNGLVPLNNTDIYPIATNASGTAAIIATTTWADMIGGNGFATYRVIAKAKNEDGNVSGDADYKITLRYAPVDMKVWKGGALVSGSTSLNAGQSVSITCASSTDMSYTASPTVPRGEYPATLNKSEIDTYKYSGTFTVNSTSTPRTYTISCTNVGADYTKQTFVISTGGAEPPTPSHDIHISNVSSSPNRARTANTFVWNADGNKCSFYNYDRSVSYGAADGGGTPDRALSPYEFTLSEGDMPSRAGVYGYYIKCYDSQYPLRQAGPAPIETFDGVSNVAWLKYNVSISCGIGEVGDENGY